MPTDITLHKLADFTYNLGQGLGHVFDTIIASLLGIDFPQYGPLLEVLLLGKMKPGTGAHDKLVRAGFLRQSHLGVFHLLPLGRRVQMKLEGLIDHYMQNLGASRVSLSTITSKELWHRSGRLAQLESELFAFEDRKGAQYMLSPTHEEEITSLVAKTVRSYKELPLRLYQITRKFRDELRPRHGLLRSREFTMKDLYTFDVSSEAALETYHKVQAAYKGVFEALKLPVMVAKASSGDMGGDLSHEYHLPALVGEDTVIICGSCDYAANTEVAETRKDVTKLKGHPTVENTKVSAVRVWRGISKDRSTLVNVWYPAQISGETKMEETKDVDVSIPAVKSIIPGLDASVDDALRLWPRAVECQHTTGQAAAKSPRLVNLIDFRLAAQAEELLLQEAKLWPLSRWETAKSKLDAITIMEDRSGQGLNLLTVRAGDRCPSCESGILRVQKALEVGHTFHLGTRYSQPLAATVSVPMGTAAANGTSQPLATEKTVPMQMGCHGIGVSRLIGAMVEHLADERGLQWPRVVAPYEVVVISSTDLAEEAGNVYDELTMPRTGMLEPEAVLDDRALSLSWKLKDADLVGYPVVVVLGKAWKQNEGCEVQCRRLGVRETVPLSGVRRRVTELLEKL
ncbi:Proline--tRNA ligase [Colletotrichum aenigma]|uniref:Proline--tRNA ligase n=1 Tax=Colletotrichum aenigma TaxID=1215731 RepID=UPI0018726244|nr:Proline--tRNA ligase [Colletotrichum aenigma]KAF5528130.1 Proline--tRNA ligase [Colletotrichum aenigma]